jgi:hypothetical protein
MIQMYATIKTTIFIGCRELNGFWHRQAQNQIKKLVVIFNPFFMDNTLLIHKKGINKVGVKWNSSSNGVNIILYFRKFLKYSLIKESFFQFSEKRS